LFDIHNFDFSKRSIALGEVGIFLELKSMVVDFSRKGEGGIGPGSSYSFFLSSLSLYSGKHPYEDILYKSKDNAQAQVVKRSYHKAP